MTPNTFLWRQIHPSFFQAGQVTSQAFRPTQKDSSRLSVYDGDQINAENSWIHYTNILELNSCGVLSVSVDECQGFGLRAEHDKEIFLEHVSICFDGLTNGQCESKAKRLRNAAMARGWQFQPPPTPPGHSV